MILQDRQRLLCELAYLWLDAWILRGTAELADDLAMIALLSLGIIGIEALAAGLFEPPQRRLVLLAGCPRDAITVPHGNHRELVVGHGVIRDHLLRERLDLGDLRMTDRIVCPGDLGEIRLRRLVDEALRGCAIHASAALIAHRAGRGGAGLGDRRRDAGARRHRARIGFGGVLCGYCAATQRSDAERRRAGDPGTCSVHRASRARHLAL